MSGSRLATQVHYVVVQFHQVPASRIDKGILLWIITMEIRWLDLIF